MKVTINLTPPMVAALKEHVEHFNTNVLPTLSGEPVATDINNEATVLLIDGMVNAGMLKCFTDAYRY